MHVVCTWFEMEGASLFLADARSSVSNRSGRPLRHEPPPVSTIFRIRSCTKATGWDGVGVPMGANKGRGGPWRWSVEAVGRGRRSHLVMFRVHVVDRGERERLKGHVASLGLDRLRLRRGGNRA